ncbi:hypothetical protein [Streptomyces sp. CAU 1734]|uniref:helix-turn-helix transcriptional regulator n=1 Tax=Streptomyces sp. CAU 1734 TaxID=3140360 RepID=UPI0032615406
MQTLMALSDVPVEPATLTRRRDELPSPYADDTDLVETERHQGGDGARVTAWLADPDTHRPMYPQDFAGEEETPRPPILTNLYTTHVADRDDESAMSAAILHAKLAIIAHRARPQLLRLDAEEDGLDGGFAGTPYEFRLLPNGVRAHNERAADQAARDSRIREFRELHARAVTSQARIDAGEKPYEDPRWVAKRLAEAEKIAAQERRIREIRQTDRPQLLLAITAHLLRLGASRQTVLDLMGWTGGDAETITHMWDHVTTAQSAALMGISPGTMRGYVARGQAPQPDRRISDTPLWKVESILAWESSRPGRPGRPKQQS